jgi:hypothetical protein
MKTRLAVEGGPERKSRSGYISVTNLEWKPVLTWGAWEFLAAGWWQTLGDQLARIDPEPEHPPVPTVWLGEEEEPRLLWLSLATAARLGPGSRLPPDLSGAPDRPKTWIRADFSPDYELYLHLWRERHAIWQNVVRELNTQQESAADAAEIIRATLEFHWRLWDAPWEWYLAAATERSHALARLTRCLDPHDLPRFQWHRQRRIGWFSLMGQQMTEACRRETGNVRHPCGVREGLFPGELPLPPLERRGHADIAVPTEVPWREPDLADAWRHLRQHFPAIRQMFPAHLPETVPDTVPEWERLNGQFIFPLRRRYRIQHGQQGGWLEWRQLPDWYESATWWQWVTWTPFPPATPVPLPSSLQTALSTPGEHFWSRGRECLTRRKSALTALAGWLRDRAAQHTTWKTAFLGEIWTSNPLRQAGIPLRGATGGRMSPAELDAWWKQNAPHHISGADLLTVTGNFTGAHLTPATRWRRDPNPPPAHLPYHLALPEWELPSTVLAEFLLGHHLSPPRTSPGSAGNHFENLCERICALTDLPEEAPMWDVELFRDSVAAQLVRAWEPWIQTALWIVAVERFLHRCLWEILDLATRQRHPEIIHHTGWDPARFAHQRLFPPCVRPDRAAPEAARLAISFQESAWESVPGNDPACHDLVRLTGATETTPPSPGPGHPRHPDLRLALLHRPDLLHRPYTFHWPWTALHHPEAAAEPGTTRLSRRWREELDHLWQQMLTRAGGRPSSGDTHP